jgi:hypothetical protein
MHVWSFHFGCCFTKLLDLSMAIGTKPSEIFNEPAAIVQNRNSLALEYHGGTKKLRIKLGL